MAHEAFIYQTIRTLENLLSAEAPVARAEQFGASLVGAADETELSA